MSSILKQENVSSGTIKITVNQSYIQIEISESEIVDSNTGHIISYLDTCYFPLEINSVVSGIASEWIFRNSESIQEALSTDTSIPFEYVWDPTESECRKIKAGDNVSVSNTSFKDAYIFYYMCESGFRFRVCESGDNYTGDFNKVFTSGGTDTDIQGIYDFSLSKLSRFNVGSGGYNY